LRRNIAYRKSGSESPQKQKTKMETIFKSLPSQAKYIFYVSITLSSRHQDICEIWVSEKDYQEFMQKIPKCDWQNVSGLYTIEILDKAGNSEFVYTFSDPEKFV